MPDQNDAPRAVDVGDHQTGDLGGSQPGRVAASERRPALQARHGFEKLHDFVGAQNGRQFARLSRVRDALGNDRLDERDALKETQRADDLDITHL